MSKERLWGIELIVLLKLSQSSDIFLVDITKKLTGSSLREIVATIIADDCPTIDFSELTSRLQQVISNFKYKLSYNAPPVPIINGGEQFIAVSKEWIAEHDAFNDIFNNKTKSFAGRLRQGTKILSLFVAATRVIAGAKPLLEALQKGDIKGFFEASTQSETAVSVLADIGDAIANTAKGEVKLTRRTLDAISVLEDKTRAEALFDESLTGYTETYMRQLVLADMAAQEVIIEY